MQLQELEIDRFGIWRDVRIPFQERGVTVLYGPNEAGKSTLMRFIRGVLYGYQPRDEQGHGPRASAISCAGSLRLRHRGQEYRLQRVSHPGTRGRLEINGRAAKDDDAVMRDLIGQTPESLFQNVFAIGLHELQQLATLHGEDVAHHLYGLSLGPEGEQIFAAHRGLRAEEHGLVGKEDRDGEIQSLLKKLEELDRELGRINPSTERYSRTQSRLRDLEEGIEQDRRRQANLQQELRGRQLLTRIWEPWKKERDLRRKRDRLPTDDIDRAILGRYDELELKLSEVDDQRKSLIAEARKAQAEAQAISTRPELEQQTCAIQNLFEKTRSMQALERSLSERAPRHEKWDDRDLDAHLRELGRGWDRRRLEQAEVTAADWKDLSAAAMRFRRAGRSRSRLIRRYKKAAAALKSLEQDWKAQSRGFAGQPVDQTRAKLEKRLHDLEELRGLMTRREHLARTAELVGRDIGPRVIERELPPVFWWVIGFFMIAGACLTTFGGYAALRGYEGIVAAGPVAWIAGGSLMLIGLCAMATFWTMKEYFSQNEIRTAADPKDRDALEQELKRTEQAIDRITRYESETSTNVSVPTMVRPPRSQSVDQAIKDLRRELADLDRAQPGEAQIEARRRRLSAMRQAIPRKQKLLARARREWTDTLKRLGIDETLTISAAFDQFERLSTAKWHLRERDTQGFQEEFQRRELDAFHQQFRELAEKIEGRFSPSFNPYEKLAEWHQELQRLEERRRERARLRQLAKEKRREAAKLVDRIDRMRQQRVALLQQLGVADRGEIAAKLAAIDERATLDHQLKLAQEELRKLSEGDSDLAIAEEDLVAFDRDSNARAIETLKNDLAELDFSLQEQFESLGTLKQELRELEDDRTLTSLRFDREQVLHALEQSAEKWCATRLAGHVIERLQHEIETQRQPQLLQDASNLLFRLTCGNYRRIWTPLGEKSLVVDDDQGLSFRVEQLSSGTREQVFLAVRLAMIREFAEAGTELPMVLDDVTVNFDQSRTEAAVRTLLDVASQGQQVLLFTCHLHLAQLFEQQGVEPVWLPTQRNDLLAHQELDHAR